MQGLLKHQSNLALMRVFASYAVIVIPVVPCWGQDQQNTHESQRQRSRCLGGKLDEFKACLNMVALRA
eukprot:4842147-Amphidinium_carterae.1